MSLFKMMRISTTEKNDWIKSTFLHCSCFINLHWEIDIYLLPKSNLRNWSKLPWLSNPTIYRNYSYFCFSLFSFCIVHFNTILEKISKHTVLLLSTIPDFIQLMEHIWSSLYAVPRLYFQMIFYLFFSVLACPASSESRPIQKEERYYLGKI